MNEWISVKDRLPSSERPVLTYSRGMAMPVIVTFYAQFYGEDDEEWYEYWQARDGIITHWRELPAPPNTSK